MSNLHDQEHSRLGAGHDQDVHNLVERGQHHPYQLSSRSSFSPIPQDLHGEFAHGPGIPPPIPMHRTGHLASEHDKTTDPQVLLRVPPSSSHTPPSLPPPPCQSTAPLFSSNSPHRDSARPHTTTTHDGKGLDDESLNSLGHCDEWDGSEFEPWPWSKTPPHDVVESSPGGDPIDVAGPSNKLTESKTEYTRDEARQAELNLLEKTGLRPKQTDVKDKEGHKKYLCPECMDQLKPLRKSQTINHILSQHGPPEDFPFRCSQCRTPFATLPWQETHQGH
ncbi:hypothetical protein T439DRAFT_33984 [Meredithblackwellia eburnea MCA 4105]